MPGYDNIFACMQLHLGKVIVSQEERNRIWFVWKFQSLDHEHTFYSVFAKQHIFATLPIIHQNLIAWVCIWSIYIYILYQENAIIRSQILLIVFSNKIVSFSFSGTTVAKRWLRLSRIKMRLYTIMQSQHQ